MFFTLNRGFKIKGSSYDWFCTAHMAFFVSDQKNSRELKIGHLIPRIEQLYREKYYKGIRNLINNTSIELLVPALEEINDIDLMNLFLVASQNISGKMSQIFLSFTTENQTKILEKIKPIVLSELLEELNANDVVQILSFLDVNIIKKIILAAKPTLRVEIKQIKKFDPIQIGSIMNTTFLSLEEEMKVGDALSYLRKKKNEFDIEQEIFVINKDKNIVGQIKIQNLFFWDEPATAIKELMDKTVVCSFAHEDIEDAIDVFQKYHINVLAILNEAKELIGIVTGKDIIPEIIEENMEDVHKFYGISSYNDSYFRSSIYEIVKSRILWLVILLFATTFTTLIIDQFELWGYEWTSGISSAVLVPLIPVITDMSGNAGSQTTATIIQALSNNEIKKNDFKKVLKKEMQVALLIGSILCVINFLRLFVYFIFFPIKGEKININASVSMVQMVSYIDSFQGLLPIYSKSGGTLTSLNKFLLGLAGAGVSSIALFCVIVVSKILGCFVPFLALKLDYDPAAFSTPVLTTLLDILSSLIFFGLGILVLKYAGESILGKTISLQKT